MKHLVASSDSLGKGVIKYEKNDNFIVCYVFYSI